MFVVFHARYLGLSPFATGVVAASAGVGGTIGTMGSSPILGAPFPTGSDALPRDAPGPLLGRNPLTLLAPPSQVATRFLALGSQ